jgi:hypothetical protein
MEWPRGNVHLEERGCYRADVFRDGLARVAALRGEAIVSASGGRSIVDAGNRYTSSRAVFRPTRGATWPAITTPTIATRWTATSVPGGPPCPPTSRATAEPWACAIFPGTANGSTSPPGEATPGDRAASRGPGGRTGTGAGCTRASVGPGFRGSPGAMRPATMDAGGTSQATDGSGCPAADSHRPGCGGARRATRSGGA